MGGRYRPNTSPFQKGDIVVLKTGTAPQQVMEIKWNDDFQRWDLRGQYTRWFNGIDDVTKQFRRASDYQLYEGDPALHDYETKKATSAMAQSVKLYQTNEETPRFGTLLAVNSVGQLVLEIKTGTGVNVEAFDKDKVEEVKPYTILVITNDNRERHLTCTKDAVAEDDILILDSGEWCRVSKINTGFSGATAELKGRKVQTVAI